jgi:hypothetical protein
MREYMERDPIVQRLSTPKELGQESTECEKLRSWERRNESRPLVG